MPQCQSLSKRSNSHWRQLFTCLAQRCHFTRNKHQWRRPHLRQSPGANMIQALIKIHADPSFPLFANNQQWRKALNEHLPWENKLLWATVCWRSGIYAKLLCSEIVPQTISIVWCFLTGILNWLSLRNDRGPRWVELWSVNMSHTWLYCTVFLSVLSMRVNEVFNKTAKYICRKQTQT